MKQLSTARIFKLITGKDIFQKLNELKKIQDTGGEGMTEVMDFLHYGLYLSYNVHDLQQAKKMFSDFNETFEYDTQEQGFKELVERFSSSVA